MEKKKKTRKHDFTNLTNTDIFENMDTSVADLTRQIVRIIQSGDLYLAEQYLRSEPYLQFQAQLRLFPEYIATSYTYNCVAAYISALTSLSSYSGAEKLLETSTKRRYRSVEDWLLGMNDVIIGFTELVSEEKRLSHSEETHSFLSRRAGAYIRDHLFGRTTPEEIAAYCGCSLSYLRHEFKKDMAIPMGQYIQKCKIEKAKTMLMETDSPVAHIAHQLGFGSESYFISVFKKYEQMTPNGFRRQNSSL